MKLPTISAREVFKLAKEHNIALLDVRAPIEFAKGHLPGTFNGPILEDAERHVVGTTYKSQGQAAAIALGHSLVDPTRAARVTQWKDYLSRQARPIVTCWRGGLRSQLAQTWIAEAGLVAERVDGGYKALRAVLLEEIEKPWAGVVVAGPTGSGKTTFLRGLHGVPGVLDLERMAGHRGSSFGGLFLPTQPAQATFENSLGMHLLDSDSALPLILEDESRLIGRCVIPDVFFARMRAMPRLVLEVPQEERIENLKREYVLDPIASGHSFDSVRDALVVSVRQLRNRLGGEASSEIESLVYGAFWRKNSHEAWIGALLSRYYDGMYEYSMAKHKGEVAFRGGLAEARAFLARQ